MAIVTFDGGQSAAATNGQSTTYIVQKILQQMPAAPDTLVGSMLQDVIREFYTKSAGYRAYAGPYVVNAGIDTYSLNPVDQFTQLQFVLQAFLYPGVNGGNTRQWLRPTTRKIYGTDVDIPSAWWMQTPDTMVLYPVPSGTLTGAILYVYGIMIPTINTPQLPDVSTTHHLDALMWGTMARMFRMKSRPWADTGLAKEYQTMYVKEMRRLRDEANRSFMGTDTPISFPPFAGSFYSGSQLGVRNSF